MSPFVCANSERARPFHIPNTNVSRIIFLEFGLRGIPDIDTTLETWIYSGSLHNGFDGNVMTLDIPDYVNASISLTKDFFTGDNGIGKSHREKKVNVYFALYPFDSSRSFLSKNIAQL